ncbi:MAG: iron-containing alcohol dehydrogenase [Pirellulaceae bacterium]|nr:iron-containing alcohol dehydrogenase [Pirellulaceae bacterium]
MQVEATDKIKAFDYDPRTRIVFGSGSLRRLGEISAAFGQRVLVVSDPGVVQVGHTQQGVESLEAAGLDVVLYDGARENPTTANVESGVALARDFSPDLLVGLGGGSSMDCAKGINFLYSCGGEMQDYWGVGKASSEMLPMIAVPTTAGTGSEMQSFALISDSDTHVKMACGDKRAACRVAILDPDLTLTQPTQVTALTGIDAISHALETFVTTKRNTISNFFSKESWRLLATHFRTVMKNPNDVEARGAMQLGAAFAGLAIENSMLGASHALANPLTAEYGVAHGQAVGMMLPHVIRFNAVTMESFYQELHSSLDSSAFGKHRDSKESEQLAELVEDLLTTAGLETRLSSLGVDQTQLDRLAEDASTQWTGRFNPREVNPTSLRLLYEKAY